LAAVLNDPIDTYIYSYTACVY